MAPTSTRLLGTWVRLLGARDHSVGGRNVVNRVGSQSLPTRQLQVPNRRFLVPNEWLLLPNRRRQGRELGCGETVPERAVAQPV